MRLLDRQVTQLSEFDPDLADGIFHVTDRDGKLHHLPGIEGYRLMEILRDVGLPVAATCGGAAACGTCHVFVAPAWREKLPPPCEDETEKLDELLHLADNSRLSCQLIWRQDQLDGLELTLAPEER